LALRSLRLVNDAPKKPPRNSPLSGFLFLEGLAGFSDAVTLHKIVRSAILFEELLPP